jgi:hypothetical protein
MCDYSSSSSLSIFGISPISFTTDTHCVLLKIFDLIFHTYILQACFNIIHSPWSRLSFSLLPDLPSGIFFPVLSASLPTA